MRKQDYADLARIIREERARAAETVAHAAASAEAKERARGAYAALAVVADRFATLASVDKVPFMQACAIVRT